MAAAAMLDLFEQEIAPLDPSSLKPHSETKYEGRPVPGHSTD